MSGQHRTYRFRRPYRRGLGRLHGRPLRRPVHDGAYTRTTPLCWRDRESYINHAMQVYDVAYQRLLEDECTSSVSRAAFYAVLVVMAGDAHHRTGRGCSITVDQTRQATGLSRRVVQRVRRLMRLVGLMTEVQAGRRRTYAEREESWRRGDPKQGWAAVNVLHESTDPRIRADLAVDNSAPETSDDQPIGTPLTDTPVGSESFSSQILPTTSMGKKSSRSRRRRAAAFDPAALDLAEKCRVSPKMPAWMRRHGAKAWAAVLTKPAQHGWTDADVIAALDQRARHRPLLDHPRNAVAYLASVLKGCDLTTPPAVAERAARAEQHARLLAEQAARRAEYAERDRLAARPDSPARLAALALIDTVLAQSRKKRGSYSDP